jgi:hypothetical protein
LVLYQALLQSAVVLALHMHIHQLLQILLAVAVVAVAEQPKIQVQIMVELQRKLCPLVRHLNMEMLEVQLQTRHTNLVEVAEVLVQSVVRLLEAGREVQVVQE